MDALGAVRMRDWQVFAEVSRAKSIREAGRRLGITSGQVSKTVQGLESRLGVRLFKRSASGMLLTEVGAEIIAVASEVLASSQRIETLLGGAGSRIAPVLGVAGTSFLTAHLLVPALSSLPLGVTFRFLDLAPDQLVPAGLRSAFEVAAHFGRVAWPGTWVSEFIGKAEWRLCARIRHPLSSRPALKEILKFPFVVPTYWTSEGLVRGNDQFPIPATKRKIGFETATAEAAVPVLLNSDHVAFLPAPLTRAWVERGEMKILVPRDLPKVERDLYLSARADSLSVKVYEQMAMALKATL